MKDDNKKMITVVTSVLAIATALISFYANEKFTYNKRLDEKTKQVDELRDLHQAAQIQMLSLQYELDKKVTIVTELEKYIDELPIAAWIKIYDRDEDEFTMLMINRAYERLFDVTKYQYNGYTDSEIWGDQIAEQFKRNDIEILKVRRSKCFSETLNDNETVRVCKFPIFMGKQKGVGGIVTDREIF